MSDKFRSIKAFKEFEQRDPSQRMLSSSGPQVEQAAVSELRVLATVKAQLGGMLVVEIAQALATTPGAVERAALNLAKEGLVDVRDEAGALRIVAK